MSTSTDETVTKDLVETLEDGEEGFRQGAEKLDDTDSPELALTFKEYRKALDADISAGLRTVVERQARDVKAAHDRVRAMRDAHS